MPTNNTTEIARAIKDFKQAFEDGGDDAHYKKTEWEIVHTASNTHLGAHGVRLISKDDNAKGKKDMKFICLSGKCADIKDDNGAVVGSPVTIYKTSSDKAATHLLEKHNVAKPGKKAETTRANKARFNRISNETHQAARNDSVRYAKHLLAHMTARHGIPFKTWSDEAWNLFQRLLDLPEDALKNFDVRESLVEIYCHYKKTIMAAIDEARAFYKETPFLSFNLDLYQDPVQNKKYLGIRISWMNPKTNVLESYPIAFREYSPTFAERQKEEASKILADWFTAVIAEFGIALSELFAGSGDAGSDVKKSMDTHLDGVLREWCLSHLLNLVMADAFGSSVDQAKSKNKPARLVINSARKVVESVNKSTDLKKNLEDLQRESSRGSNKEPLKLLSSPLHRWGANEDVFRRLLILWPFVAAAYRRTSLTFPLSADKTVMEEFFSLLYPVRRVQERSQKLRAFVLISVYLQLVRVYNSLDACSPVVMMHPQTPAETLGEQSGPEKRPFENLDQRSKTVQKLLREGLNKRFFNRFHPIFSWKNWRHVHGANAGGTINLDNVQLKDLSYDYIFDMALLLCPLGRDGIFLGRLCKKVDITDGDVSCLPAEKRNIAALRKQHAKFLETALWRAIFTLALPTAREKFRELEERRLVAARESVVARRAPVTPSPPKKAKLHPMVAAGLMSPEPDQEDDGNQEDEDNNNDDVVDRGFQNPNEIVDAEIKLYREMEMEQFDPNDPDKTPFWWDLYQKELPCLRVAAKVVFGMLAGSGALECDIGFFKDIISAKRGSLSPGMVEVLGMVRLNKSLAEYNTLEIEVLLGDNWKDRVPKRPEFPTNYFGEDDSAAGSDGDED